MASQISGSGAGAGGPGRSGGAPRPQRPQGPGERPTYQIEERYWTDYLRVALPVVGLLLLLGLFWYWASSLIGDDASQPGATPTTGVAVVITQVQPTALPTQAVVEVQPTTPADQAQPTVPPTTAPSTTDGSQNMGDGGSGLFAIDDTVVINDDDVNLRAEPSRSAEVVEVMSLGTELVVTGAEVTADGYVWWPVEDPATGLTGFVAEDFLDPS